MVSLVVALRKLYNLLLVVASVRGVLDVQFGSNFKVLCRDIQLVFGMEDCLKVNDNICGSCCMVLFLGWMLLTGFLKTFVQVPVLKAPTMLDKRVRICYNF